MPKTSTSYGSLSENEFEEALENCAKEPIHLINSIQPQGVLFVLSEPDMLILQLSANAGHHLGIDSKDLLGKPLSYILPDIQVKALKNIITSGSLQPIKSIAIKTKLDASNKYFDAIIHKSQENLILEIEPANSDGDSELKDLQNFYSSLRSLSIKLNKAESLETLNKLIVEEIRSLTGFDRIKIYKFDDNWDGTVIEESCAEHMPSYLNLRFPASDIPEQARKLYSKSYLRLMPDVDFQAVPIISSNNEVVDLSLSTLRSVSPIHIQYLNNMDIRASMSISIIQNQKLWGLIVCHHNETKHISFNIRMAAELIGHIFSSQLSVFEEAEKNKQEQNKQLLASNILASLNPEKKLKESLKNNINALAEIVESDGILISINGELCESGSKFQADEIPEILDFLKSANHEEILSCNKLEKTLQKTLQSNISGILASPVDKDSNTWIIWLREESISKVNWAGKPEKNVQESSLGLRLTPRASFSLWQEIKKGQSKDWSEQDLFFAQKIKALMQKKAIEEKHSNKQKELESIISEKSAHMKAIFDAVQEVIVTIDQYGTIMSANPSISKILGYTEEELINKNVKILMPEEIAQEHGDYLPKYLESMQGSVLGRIREVEAKHKDGSLVPLELAIEQMFIKEKPMFVGTLRDLTEKNKALSALNESKSFLQLILENNPDYVFVKDQKLRIIMANTAFLNLYPENIRDQVIGHTTAEFYNQDEADEFFKYDLEAFEKGSSEAIETIAFPSGETITVFTKKVRFENNAGDPLILGTSRDVTEREVLIKQLEQSNDELDEFAYIASHDLKEPLRGIHNHAHLLNKDYKGVLGEEGNRRINRMMALAQHMEALISDLLYFSRVGRVAEAYVETDLNILVKEIVDSVLSAEENVEINIVDELPTMVCDRVRAGEVFRNLINNAIKYNKNKIRKIEIGSKYAKVSNKAEFILSVKDNGLGIEEKFYSDIFRIFKRLHRKDIYGGGTGSGLTFVKKIVERHGGEIWLESELDKGTTFFFTLSGKHLRK